MREVNSLGHTRWECKYLVYPEVSVEGVIWSDTSGVKCISSFGPSEGESDRRRASDAGSCAHDVVDTAEVWRSAGIGLYFKGKRAIHVARTYMGREELCRAAFLGLGLFCFDGGTG